MKATAGAFNRPGQFARARASALTATLTTYLLHGLTGFGVFFSSLGGISGSGLREVFTCEGIDGWGFFFFFSCGGFCRRNVLLVCARFEFYELILYALDFGAFAAMAEMNFFHGVMGETDSLQLPIKLLPILISEYRLYG